MSMPRRDPGAGGTVEPGASESSVEVGAEGLIGAPEWGVNRRRRGREGFIPRGCRSEGFIGSFMFSPGLPRFTGPPQKTRRSGGRRAQSRPKLNSADISSLGLNFGSSFRSNLIKYASYKGKAKCYVNAA